MLPGERVRGCPGVGLVTRDLLELVGAVIRELQQDDRAAVLAEVGARPREDEVGAVHLIPVTRVEGSCVFGSEDRHS